MFFYYYQTILPLKVCYQGSCINMPISESIDSSLCMPNPCMNNGRCIAIDQIYLCNCQNGFTGFFF